MEMIVSARKYSLALDLSLRDESGNRILRRGPMGFACLVYDVDREGRRLRRFLTRVAISRW